MPLEEFITQYLIQHLIIFFMFGCLVNVKLIWAVFLPNFYTLRAKEKNKNSLYEVANKEIRQVKPSKKDLKNMANFKI